MILWPVPVQKRTGWPSTSSPRTHPDPSLARGIRCWPVTMWPVAGRAEDSKVATNNTPVCVTMTTSDRGKQPDLTDLGAALRALKVDPATHVRVQTLAAGGHDVRLHGWIQQWTGLNFCGSSAGATLSVDGAEYLFGWFRGVRPSGYVRPHNTPLVFPAVTPAAERALT